MVEDRSPFCPSCGVPQIRFSAREPASDAVVMRVGNPAAGVSSNFSSTSISPPSVSRPSYGQLEAEVPNRRRATGFDRPVALRSALNAGAIAAVVSLIPLAFFLAAPLAGYLGVRHYQRYGGMQEMSTRAGFKFGVLVGLFASPIFAVLRAAQIVASGPRRELRTMIEKLQQAAAGNPDPYAHRLADYFATAPGMIVLIIFTLVFICVAFVLLSGVGGAISASVGRRKN